MKRFMVLHFNKITLKPTCWTPLPFFFILGTVCHNILHSLVKNQYKKFTCTNGFEFPTWFPSFLLCDKPLGMPVWEANLILSSLNFRNVLCDTLMLYTLIINDWVCWIQNWLSSRSPGWRHCAVFSGNTIYCHGAPLNTGTWVILVSVSPNYM